MTDGAPILAVEDLTLEFRTRSGTVHALDGVSWSLQAGETLGLVGESGSGKSVSAYGILGLLGPATRVVKGRVLLRGVDILAAGEEALRRVRGREIAMIFQDPRSALNPIRSVGQQIEDVLRRNSGMARRAARRKAVELLGSVKIAAPERCAASYPFELSGGMCQRVGIALALACEPAILIADEPTTGLDVTTQATVMDLVKELASARQMSTLLITHDLGLASENCDRIAVMHAGHVVETAPTPLLFARPVHPYTRRLITATPTGRSCLGDLVAIEGSLPDLRRSDLPPCRFSERCERYLPECDRGRPPLVGLGAGQCVACWRAS